MSGRIRPGVAAVCALGLLGASVVATSGVVAAASTSLVEPSPFGGVPVPYPSATSPRDVAGGTAAVAVDLDRFVASTSLLGEEDVQRLVNERAGYFAREPTYRESVAVVDDKVVVDRTLRFDLAPGVCNDLAARAELGDLCFGIHADGVAPAEVAGDLAEIRARLIGRDPSSRVADGISVADAAAMTDRQLLDLVLNGGRRTIKRVSTIPIQGPTIGHGAFVDDAGAVGPQQFEPQILIDEPDASSLGGLLPRRPEQDWGALPNEFDTRYFMTGFTLEDHIDDRWEYTIADSSWWHGRYYIRFDYAIAARIGVRVPFQLDVNVRSGDRSQAKVDLSVDTVDVDHNGLPAYPATGLGGDAAGGKEFVLEVLIGCRLKVSIPGPDYGESCKGVIPGGIDLGRDIVPVLGNEVHVLEDWVLDSSDTGLEMSLGPSEFPIAKASIDLGLRADIRNGRIGFRIDPSEGTELTGVAQDVVWRDSADPVAVALTRKSGTADLGFTVTDPRYAFELGVHPIVTFNAGIDVGVYENSWSETFDLDFLRIQTEVELEHHAGTVERHDYVVHWGEQAVDEPAATPVPSINRLPDVTSSRLGR